MNDIWDLVIIGAGPSALTAAVYAGREGLKTLIIEKQLIGGQVATIDRIDNYPGFSDGVEGLVLAQDFEAQARRFGAEIKFGEVTGLRRDEGNVMVRVDNGDVAGRAVLVATGSGYRHLDIPGEAENYSRGVHYCATCDGALYRDKELVTVGGANSAVQEALFLTKFARHITMLVRSWIKADQILKDQLEVAIQDGRVTLIEGWRPTEIVATDGRVSSVKATDDKSERDIVCDGVFIFAGSVPNTTFLRDGDVKLDAMGQIVVDDKLRTSMLGVWAAGDVRTGAARQIVSAAGDGAVAAIQIGKYLRGIS